MHRWVGGRLFFRCSIGDLRCGAFDLGWHGLASVVWRFMEFEGQGITVKSEPGVV